MEQTTNQFDAFLTAKAAITGVTGAFTIAFGWLGWLVIAWVGCMALDWFTGSMAACKQGKWASKLAREGIYHKAGMMVVAVVAAIADGVLATVMANIPALSIPYTNAILPIVLVWYIFAELGSMAENAAEMGAPVPAFLAKMLQAGKSAAEGQVGDGED